MEFKASQKEAMSDGIKSGYIPKACENFKLNNREAVPGSPWNLRNGYCLLPTHSTPPSSIFKIRNPFDRNVVERLHLSFCSPTVFIPGKSNSTDNEKFEWTIDEISKVNPADIEVCSSQTRIKNDPVIEHNAQNAINDFFKKDRIVSSPEFNLGQVVLPVDNPARKRAVKSCSSQTELTIPPKVPEDVENMLKQFCTFTHDQQESLNNSFTKSNDSLRRNLFQDEHVLNMCNDKFMDYSTLSPPPQSPAFNLLSGRSKSTRSTPIFHNISTPSSISPILKKESPLRSSSISPISKCEYRSKDINCENTMISLSAISPRASVTIESSYYLPDEVENNKNYPFCQSTPERAMANKANHSRKQNILQECSSLVYNQCYKDFQCNMMRRHKSITKLQFTDENMSVDNSKLEFENIECVEISYSPIKEKNDLFRNSIGKFENGMVPLSPMQTSQMETPFKKRTASAKNLSRSFGLLQENAPNTLNEGSGVRVDSGYTESFNTLDSLTDMIKHRNKQNGTNSQTSIFRQCHDCNNIIKLQLFNYNNVTEMICNHCSGKIL